jgi:hypothetical protein
MEGFSIKWIDYKINELRGEINRYWLKSINIKTRI